MGAMIDRRHRELTDEEISKISGTYHAWRSKGGKYKDMPGFCKSVKLDEVRKHGHILTPGRYVGTEEIEEDDEVFEEKMKHLTGQLSEQFKKSTELEKEIGNNLRRLGYEI
jgi:type I restriction enzyme M protein